ncbi:MAG: helix-turn-helix domain-containing protein [Gemmatimonadota bacterium]
MENKKLLRVAEAAQAMDIGRSLLYRLIMSGQIRSVVVGGRSRRVPVEAIDEFIARELADQADATSWQSVLPPAKSGEEKV